MQKFLGKISKVKLGFGGYQDAIFGLTLDFSFDGSCCVSTFISGGWTIERSSGAKWTESDRAREQGELSAKVIELLKDAKVSDVTKLAGIPVEITLEGNCFKEFRILKEVL